MSPALAGGFFTTGPPGKSLAVGFVGLGIGPQGDTVSLSVEILRLYFLILKLSCDDPLGFPGGTSGKEPACQFRRHKRRRFDPWVRKIPWR